MPLEGQGRGRVRPAVHQRRHVEGEDALRLVQIAVAPGAVAGDVRQRRKGEELEETLDVAVVRVAPVLVELVDRGLRPVQPHRALLRLAHLAAGGGGQKRQGEGAGLLRRHAADQVDAREHVRPLVVATQLQPAFFRAEEVQEIVGLQQHVVELEE